MLSIAKLAPEHATYYERSVARGRDDYYAGRGEAPGRWIGAGAAALGLSGELADGELSQLLRLEPPGSPEPLRTVQPERVITVAGVDPQTGEQREEQRVLAPLAGYDMAFAAPKSLSLVEAIADRETPEGRYAAAAIAAAHEAGVAAALEYLEAHACQVRRGRGGAERVPAQGFIAARFDHRTSRAQDPHRHSHVIAANAATTGDGKHRALDGKAILEEHRLAAGHVYQAALREAMSQRGFRFGEMRKGMAELADVPTQTLAEFSQRRQQVLEHMAAQGTSGYYGAQAEI